MLVLRPGSFLYGVNLRAYHHFSTNGLCGLLEEAGFSIVDVVAEKDTEENGGPLRFFLRKAHSALAALAEALAPGRRSLAKVISVYAVKEAKPE